MGWLYQGEEVNSIEDVPEGAIGIVYNIVLSDGREYIGKKSLYSDTWPETSEKRYKELKAEGKEVKKSKNKAESKKRGKTVWRYKRRVLKESNWKTYNSSNEELKEYIKKGGHVTKYILQFAYSKKELTYLEEKHLYCNNVLEHGDKFLNSNIAGRFFKSDTKNMADNVV